jgi:rhodanese-related sulfurtransferase
MIEPTSTLTGGVTLTEEDVPRVSVEDAAAAIQNGEAIVLDVRSTQAFQASHIPGALSVPLFDIETNPTGLNLDKDQWIITYCT